MIFEALKSELFKFKFRKLSSKIVKIPEFNLFMTPSLHDRILDAFQKKQKTNPVVMSGYGATEMASSMVMYRPGVLDDLEKQKMTVGRVRKPIQVKIIDDDGKELRVVQTQAILFLKSMSERVGSDLERLWI